MIVRRCQTASAHDLYAVTDYGHCWICSRLVSFYKYERKGYRLLAISELEVSRKSGMAGADLTGGHSYSGRRGP